MKCAECGSYAINHHLHGRDGSDPDLCDVCYWRKRCRPPEGTAPSQGEYGEMLILACKELLRRTGNIESQKVRYWWQSPPNREPFGDPDLVERCKKAEAQVAHLLSLAAIDREAFHRAAPVTPLAPNLDKEESENEAYQSGWATGYGDGNKAGLSQSPAPPTEVMGLVNAFGDAVEALAKAEYRSRSDAHVEPYKREERAARANLLAALSTPPPPDADNEK